MHLALLEDLRDRVQEAINDPVVHWASHSEADLAALAIFFVGVCCVVAVLSRSVRDTVLERVAFGMLALSAFGRAAYIFAEGDTIDGAFLCYSLAFYCAVIIWKHMFVIPRRPDYVPPEDMPKY